MYEPVLVLALFIHWLELWVFAGSPCCFKFINTVQVYFDSIASDSWAKYYSVLTVFVFQMSTMPGLPTRPCFYDIDLDMETGEVQGLF